MRNLKCAETDDGDFIHSLVKEISKAIKDAASVKYENVGGRELIHEVASTIRDSLQRGVPGLEMGIWPKPDMFTLCPHRTVVTLWFILHFKAEGKPPYTPVDLLDDKGRMCLTVWSMLKLSSKGMRDPKLKSRWLELTKAQKLDVPGVGTHELEGRWFTFERQICEPPEQVSTTLTKMGATLLRWISEF